MNIVIFMLVGFIIPLLLAFVLKYNLYKKNLRSNINFTRGLGILYMDTKDSDYFWELVTMIVVIINKNLL